MFTPKYTPDVIVPLVDTSRPLSVQGVTERYIRAHVNPNFAFESRDWNGKTPSAQAKAAGVSMTEVAKALDALVAEGTLVQIGGVEVKRLGRAYGTQPTGRYYWHHEQYRMAKEAMAARSAARYEAALRRRAIEDVLGAGDVAARVNARIEVLREQDKKKETAS